MHLYYKRRDPSCAGRKQISADRIKRAGWLSKTAAFPLPALGIIDRMKARSLAWVVWIVIAAAALVLAYQALQSAQEVSVIVEWSTASELNTAGYSLFRAETADGPFEQVNEFLIPGSPDPLTGGDYEFTDTAVTPGTTYYYRLEEVETSGARTNLGVIEVRADAGGRLELVLAGILFAGAVLGLVDHLRKTRRPASQPGAPLP